MLQNLRVYTLSVELHRAAERAPLPSYLKQQLLRATSSVSLNIAEGYGKESKIDRRRYFVIALGSIREVQAALDLAGSNDALVQLADRVGASIYRFCYPLRSDTGKR